MLHRLNVQRRLPAYVFSGEPLIIDYTVENSRRWFAALALFLEDLLLPVDRSISGATNVTPRSSSLVSPAAIALQLALAVEKPRPRQVSASRSRSGHSRTVRARRASRHDFACRSDARLSQDRPS